MSFSVGVHVGKPGSGWKRACSQDRDLCSRFEIGKQRLVLVWQHLISHRSKRVYRDWSVNGPEFKFSGCDVIDAISDLIPHGNVLEYTTTPANTTLRHHGKACHLIKHNSTFRTQEVFSFLLAHQKMMM